MMPTVTYGVVVVGLSSWSGRTMVVSRQFATGLVVGAAGAAAAAADSTDDSRSDTSSWNVASSTGRSEMPSHVAPGATLFCTMVAVETMWSSWSGPPDTDTG